MKDDMYIRDTLGDCKKRCKARRRDRTHIWQTVVQVISPEENRHRLSRDEGMIIDVWDADPCRQDFSCERNSTGATQQTVVDTQEQNDVLR
jgi:hypothetical protein